MSSKPDMSDFNLVRRSEIHAVIKNSSGTVVGILAVRESGIFISQDTINGPLLLRMMDGGKLQGDIFTQQHYDDVNNNQLWSCRNQTPDGWLVLFMSFIKWV